MLTMYSDLEIRTKDRVAWAQWAQDLVSAAHQTVDFYLKLTMLSIKRFEVCVTFRMSAPIPWMLFG